MADLRLSSLGESVSFTVVTSSGGSKTAEFSVPFPAGVYTIYSISGDSDLEIYLGAEDGTNVGYSTNGNKAIVASAPFKYVTTANANSFDAIVFEQYEVSSKAATLSTKTDAYWAPPTITDVTPSALPNQNDTTTITGTNFASDVNVKFRKSDNSTLVNAKSIVRGSETSIIATRPDTLSVSDSPYDIVVTNATTNLSAISLNAITAGEVPVWVTSTTLNSAQIGTPFSQTIQATDSDGGSSVTYAIASGSLQTGLSLNQSTGAISGTPTGSEGVTTVTVSAIDSGGNTANRTFSQTISAANFDVEYLVIGGGGAGDYGGGGGAGGMRTGTLTVDLNVNMTATIGAGGTGGKNNSTLGSNSVFSNISSTRGGVNGASGSTTKNGGSGAGGGNSANSWGTGNAGGYTPAEGYNGSRGNYYGATGGGGGAGAAAIDGSGQSGGIGGAGRSSSITGSAVIYAGGGGGGMGDVDGNGSAGGSGGGGTGGGWGYNSGRSGPTSGSFYGAGGGSQGYAQDKNGGNGYQGLIILKYPDTKTISQSGMTLSTVSSGGYKITTITAGNGTVAFT